MHQQVMAPPQTPNPAAAVNTATVNGNTYSGEMGVWIAALSTDVPKLQDLGWVTNHVTASGPTSQRPLGWQVGSQFYDTTLSQIISWDGQFWRAGAGTWDGTGFRNTGAVV